MKLCALQKSSSLWRRLLAIPKRRAMTSLQPPSGRKSMCRESNLKLTSKSSLAPKKQVGFVIDSKRQAFTLLPRKKEKFLRLVKDTLPRDTLDPLTLQRLSGKCVSMSLAINLAVSRASRSSRPVKMSAALRNEIEHWLFLET